MQYLLASYLVTVAVLGQTQAAEPLAWASFQDHATQAYRDTRYVFLGDGDLTLAIDVPPAAGQVLELLWGAKNDQRGARVVINGHSQTVQAGGYDGFRWQRVPLPAGMQGERYQVTLQAAEPKAAFLAAVRLLVSEDATGQDAGVTGSSRVTVKTAPRRLATAETVVVPTFEDLPPLERNAAQANQALRQCRDFVSGWLAHADPQTGLIPRNLTRDRTIWNAQDSAADNYPFMVLTCQLTDPDMFHGRMREMLRTEQRLTSRVDQLPDTYSFENQTFQAPEPQLERMIFGGSEYVKDGLMPLTELLGRTAWTERMLGILDSILDHSQVETSFGRIPSDNVEVNGEMMQVLGRVYWMTGQQRYLEMAIRIADYYLLSDQHPTRNMTSLRLDDHSCELVSGLTEVYVTCHFARKDRAERYREPIHAMLDRILEVGLNPDGFMFDTIDPVSGRVVREALSDNWGYNYNGFYAVFLVDGTERYRDAVVRALRSLNQERYLAYPWEGWGSDGIADCVEGALNLYNREPVDGVDGWIDTNIHRMLSLQKTDGVIEGWHGDGNFARTAIMWVLWKQQGITIRPWRPDVRLGAIPSQDGVELWVAADQPWTGKLVFDPPRHRTILNLPLDYPRINQFPEWFTVQAEEEYKVQVPGGEASAVTGQTLLDGLPVELDADSPSRTLTVRPRASE
jgi:hypothetical protein